MKNCSKADIKNAIHKILNETSTKIINLVHKNGYELGPVAWNATYTTDYEKYEDGAELLKKNAEAIFYQANISDLKRFLRDVVCKEITFISHKDIDGFIKQFNSERDTYLKKKTVSELEAKKNRAAKIAKLRRELAKLEAEDAS